jgi:uncharacterized protein YjbJ (UPF0337 family)
MADDLNRNRDLTSQGLDDSAEGKARHLKGHLKDAVGGLTGDSSLQAEGKLDEATGKLQDKLGKAERKLDRNL